MGYIFEREIGAIMNAVRARTIGESESIQLDAILRANIHPSIKAYFRNEVERLLQQERRKEVLSSRFPYGLPEVLSLRQQIDLILVQRYQFTQEEFENLLDQSVHFEFNYLCRPRWTLLSFVFEQRRTLPASDVYRKLRYCIDYAYFPRILKRYISEKGLAEVGYEEFKRIVETIDNEIVARHSSEELAFMMRPMLEFVEAGLRETPEAGARSLLPINAAVVFFEDKNLTAVKEMLERKRDVEGVQDLTLGQLALAILQSRGEETPEEKEEGAEELEEKEEIQETEGAEEGEAPAPAVTDHDALIQPPEVHAPQTRDELLTSVKPAVRKLFLRKIFRKNEAEFRSALDRLSAAGTWDEASMMLDEIFQANAVDPFSKEAVWFTDFLYARFHHESAGAQQP